MPNSDDIMPWDTTPEAMQRHVEMARDYISRHLDLVFDPRFWNANDTDDNRGVTDGRNRSDAL